MTEPFDQISGLVSVLVLTYQNFSGLFRTLETIFEQEYPLIEVIISDDCSDKFPDKEIAEWLNGVATNISIRIRKNPENLGIVAHSNHVVKECSGQYIKFLPSGDGFCTKDSLSKLISAAEKTDSLMVISPTLVCGEDFTKTYYQYPSKNDVSKLQTKSPKQLFSDIAGRNMIGAVGTLYKADFFREPLNGFDECYRNLDDWPTWLAAYREGVKIPCLSAPTVYYSLGGMSSKHGTAFDSPLLRNDLLLCIQKEILPYMDMLSARTRYVSEYRLAVLKGSTLPAKYLPIRIFIRLKKTVKEWLIREHAIISQSRFGYSKKRE